MNQLTDPRTPPALSNATPPLVTDSQIQHSALECGSRYCAQHRDIWRHYENHICKAAAPPVAEGPRPLGPVIDLADLVRYVQDVHTGPVDAQREIKKFIERGAAPYTSQQRTERAAPVPNEDG